MKRLRRLKWSLTTLAALMAAAVAMAYWMPSEGSGSGSGKITTLTPPVVTPGTPETGSLPLEWTAAAVVGDPSDTDEFTYTVERQLQNAATWDPAGGTCSGTLTALSCTDELAENGNYLYRVTAHYRSWTATSDVSDPVTVEVGGGETEPPAVSSITRPASAAELTNASSVSWVVQFSESVSGVDAGDFTLAPSVTGAGGISVATTPGDPSRYTVTAGTGTGDGTLGLDLIDDDSIRDPAHNKLGGDGTGNGDHTGGETYTIDKTAPSVESIKRPVDGNGNSADEFTNAASVEFTVEFSEGVSNVDEDDFAVDAAAGISGAAVAAVVQDSADSYTVTVATGAGDGTLALDLIDDGSIEDSAENALGGGDFTTGETYILDRTGPSVESIVRDDANPTGGGAVHWVVSFDDNSVQGVNELSGFEEDFNLVATGITGAAITDVEARSGGSYLVTASTGIGDGTLQLDVDDDGSITDQLGNPLGGPGADDGDFAGVGAVYTIDRTAPSVASVERIGVSPTRDGEVAWKVTFSEPVTGVSDDDFEPAASGLAGTPAVTSVFSSDGTHYTVSASTGSGEGTLNLNVDDDDTIADAALNRLGGDGADNGDFSGPAAAEYEVDRMAPQLLSLEMRDVDTDGFVDRVVATFDETLDASTDSSLWTLSNTPAGATTGGVTTSGATATLVINEDGSAKNTAVGSFTVALGAGSAGIRDALGNQASFAAQAPSDKAAPVVTGLTRVGDASTNAANVQWTASFSEGVSPVVNGDFSLSGTLATGSITGVSGGPSSYTVEASTGSGEGTMALGLDDSDGSVEDGAGNAVTPSTYAGEQYTIDKTAPALSTLEMFDANTDGIVDRVDATFDETLSPSGLSVTDGWSFANPPGTIALDKVTVNGTKAEVAFKNGTAGSKSTTPAQTAGDFNLSFASAAGQLEDAAGNKVTSFANQVPTDLAAPVPFDLTDTVNGTADGRFQALDTTTLAFTENVTNTASSPMSVVLTHNSSDDEWSAPGFIDATRSLGHSNYILTNSTTNTSATFTLSTLGQPIGEPHKISLQLGTCSGICTTSGNPRLDAPNVAAPATIVPAKTIKDAAGNEAKQNSAEPTFPIKLF